MKRLEVIKLDFAYGRNQILFEFDFSLEESQISCLLGPSGCGKTTALRAIAGFENPTKGEIILDGNKLNNSKIFVAPEKRQIGMKLAVFMAGGGAAAFIAFFFLRPYRRITLTGCPPPSPCECFYQPLDGILALSRPRGLVDRYNSHPFNHPLGNQGQGGR
mgnify:CR=1 FL=1